MVTRYEAQLNHKSLSAIDDAICILDIAYGAPRLATAATDISGRNGQRVSSQRATVLPRNTQCFLYCHILPG